MTQELMPNLVMSLSRLPTTVGFRALVVPFNQNVVDSSSICEAGKEGIEPTVPRLLQANKGGCFQIVAIGRNYSEHIKELNNAPPKEPFFFLKPTTSYLPSGGNVEIPNGVLAHHEGPSFCYDQFGHSFLDWQPVELGLVIGKGGRDISQDSAESHIAGYGGKDSDRAGNDADRPFLALAVDMTARNMQEVVKKKGLPWSAVKGFDTFTPIGKFIPKSSVSDAHDLKLALKINGAVKQDGTTGDMIFRIPRLIEHISSIMALEEGDLILTGTPSGVGPVTPGDNVECTLAEPSGKIIDQLTFTAIPRSGGYLFKP
ncbi:hypothetical protein J3R83DRAFT_4629 [Lanmaoa asiatica]|nr:hypothetical protein J3R83DRAFT_4629 [Lanmaoa asiatica]